ncbi:4223_t:CDS:2 [Entrophospora sp. SA101]|nr:4223_t:CDS:2 [Entrophospora sp. SA101]
MKFFEKFMPIFEGEEMENIIWPALDLYEKIHILVTHDESTFYANDGIKKFWGPQGEQPLRPKSQGASLHISEFLCETIGRLCLEEYNKYGKGDGDMDFETSGVLPLTPLTNGDDVLGVLAI